MAPPRAVRTLCAALLSGCATVFSRCAPVFYGPGDWLAARTSARGRRALAAWLLIFVVCPGIPFWFVLREALWLIGLIQIAGLIFAMWGVVSGETPAPVESEEE